MKIIVNNDKEKELMMNFIRAMHDLDMFSEIERIDHQEESIYLSHDQYRVISDNFYDVAVDSNVGEMVFDDDSCISGHCKECGVSTEGTADGDSITYRKYLESISKEQQDNWLCHSCYENQPIDE